jgi:hypothetical protein
VRAGFSGIAAEGAVAAVVAAKIGQRQENLPRVGDDAGLEVFFGGASGPEQRGKIVVATADQAQGQFARDGRSGPQIVQFRRARCAMLWGGRSDGRLGHDARFRVLMHRIIQQWRPPWTGTVIEAGVIM